MKTEFLVIGAGLSRTGTLSLMTAMEIILPGKCHHALKAYKHDQEWENILNEKMSDEELKKFFLSNDYVAGVDLPVNIIYKRMMRVFPDAKVILSVRDNPECWVKSYEEVIFSMVNAISPYWLFMYFDFFRSYITDIASDESLKYLTHKFVRSIRSTKLLEELERALATGNGVSFYNKYIEEVESTVPKEKLLRFNVKEGWEPVCKFLNVPVPNVPFPRINSRKEITGYQRRNKRRAWLLVYEMISIPLLCYGVYRLTRGRLY